MICEYSEVIVDLALHASVFVLVFIVVVFVFHLLDNVFAWKRLANPVIRAFPWWYIEWDFFIR